MRIIGMDGLAELVLIDYGWWGLVI